MTQVSKCIAKIAMRLGEFGLDFDCSSISDDCFVGSSQLLEGIAKIVMGVGIVGIALKR